MAKQQTFDFSEERSRRLLLERLDLPVREVRVLLAIHETIKPGYRLGIKRICDATLLSRATVQRALSSLKRRSLIGVERTGRASAYWIAWSNLKDFDQRACMESPRNGGKEQAAECHDGTAAAPVGVNDWFEVAKTVSALGVTWDRDLVAACEAREEGPSEVAALAESFQAGKASGRFRSAGALYVRLKNGSWPDSHQVATREKYDEHQSRMRTEATRLAQQRREAQAERRELDELEANYGARLESLSQSQLINLATSAVGSDAVNRAQKIGRELRTVFRLDLLRQLRRG